MSHVDDEETPSNYRRKLVMSQEGMYLDAPFRLAMKKLPRRKFMCRGLCVREEREFVDFMGLYWADVVTGSLYDKATGRCLSGDLRIYRKR